jgi:hypothetical protein
LIPLNPANMRIVEKFGYWEIDYFQYQGTQVQKKQFKPEEIIHIKVPAPDSPLYGLGPAQASWFDILLSYNKQLSDIGFTANMMRPDYFVSLEGASQDQVDSFMTSISSRLRGSRNSGNAIGTNKKVEISTIQGLKEIKLGEPIEITQKICSCFMYPLQKLVGNDPIKANAEDTRKAWYSDIQTFLRLYEDGMQQLLDYFPEVPDGSYIDFGNVRANDEQNDLNEQIRSDFVAGLLTIEEARSKLGYDISDTKV